jgi:hypothetical protein
VESVAGSALTASTVACLRLEDGTWTLDGDARVALDAAAATHFWYNSAPTIAVPKNLRYAAAWQGSGT